MRTPQRVTAVVVALALVAGLVGVWAWQHPGHSALSLPAPVPAEFSAPKWDQFLGSDTTPTAADYTRLSGYHPGLDTAQAQAVANVAVAVLAADLTTIGRAAWPSYWPPAATTTTPPARQCSDVKPLAVSAAVLPTIDTTSTMWVKALVPYAGTCGPDTYTSAGPGVGYVYLRSISKAGRASTAFAPVREWDIPQVVVSPSTKDLASWQLSPITACPSGDGSTQRLRTFAADAFNKMCADAKAAGVVLVTDSAYRTRAQQQQLFADAVKHYGSKSEALNWVAYADAATCKSKHCTGVAVDVEPDNTALKWLWQVVGCNTSGTTTAASTCTTGTPVYRAQTYGFVLPYQRIPGYMEFVLPIDDQTTAPADCAPAGVGVDVMVASIFRCRLQLEQVPSDQIEQVVAQALVVSKCASQWNPTAQVYAGRYATEPNPVDGRIYSETGVFGLRAELATTGWVKGKLTDPVANINAAASLWLATRGWEQFACATGTDPGLKVGPVLPQYGGPQIPVWATQY